MCPGNHCPVTKGPLSPSVPMPPAPSCAGLWTHFGAHSPPCILEQFSRRVPSTLSSGSSPQCKLGEQELISCISSAASLNCKRHPIFWKLNSDNKELCYSQELSVCALAMYMFVLSLDDGRNSLAHMKIQRDGAEAEPGCTDIWQHQLQPPGTDARPLLYPAPCSPGSRAASAQVACVAFVPSNALDRTLPSTNTLY